MAGSPSVERVVTVIDFLASRPGESFGLSELARTLGMSKAPAHGGCTTLTESGWLVAAPPRRQALHPGPRPHRRGPRRGCPPARPRRPRPPHDGGAGRAAG